MPSPHTDEDRQHFIARCMASEEARNSFPSHDQRAAFCFSQWRRHGNKNMTKIKEYGSCTGPFGFPMMEDDARELDELLEKHSNDSAFSYKHVVKNDSFECFIEKEHADVSIVTDDSIDKDKEVVDPKGVDWTTFRKNPVVTLQHAYYLPPVGKSLWQKQVKNSWKAKTQYINRPENHPSEKEWIPDTIWHMIKEGYMPAKSVGFLPLKGHSPTQEDISKDVNMHGVKFIYDSIKVFEYAACYIGSNDNALVEDVAKGVIKMPSDLAALFRIKIEEKKEEIKKKLEVNGITLEQYKSAVHSELENAVKGIQIDTDGIIARILGRV